MVIDDIKDRYVDDMVAFLPLSFVINTTFTSLFIYLAYKHFSNPIEAILTYPFHDLFGVESGCISDLNGCFVLVAIFICATAGKLSQLLRKKTYNLLIKFPNVKKYLKDIDSKSQSIRNRYPTLPSLMQKSLARELAKHERKSRTFQACSRFNILVIILFGCTLMHYPDIKTIFCTFFSFIPLMYFQYCEFTHYLRFIAPYEGVLRIKQTTSAHPTLP